MKVLFISNLFPDASKPTFGLDNARLLHELAREDEVRVLALRPTPGWPGFWNRKKFYCRAEDEKFAPVFCRTAYLPKVGSRLNHRLMARTMRAALSQIRKEFKFDAVLCAWVYPDGCAVARLARQFDFPFVVIAQGSDVHQYLKNPARRKIIPPALNFSRGVITRSGELGRLLHEAGVAPEKLHPIYNGVDFDCFHPADQHAAKIELGLPVDKQMILYVGNFFPVKNPLLLVAAHQAMNCHQPNQPSCLVMLGDGPLRKDVERAVRGSGTESLVFLRGRQPHTRVARFMQAADVLCVPSDNEGVPNVVLEAFACGLRVVATNVGGIAEVLPQAFLGQLVTPRDLQALVAALIETLAQPPATQMILDRARQFSWAQTATSYRQVLTQS